MVAADATRTPFGPVRRVDAVAVHFTLTIAAARKGVPNMNGLSVFECCGWLQLLMLESHKVDQLDGTGRVISPKLRSCGDCTLGALRVVYKA